VRKAIEELSIIANRVEEVGTPEVPWFPTRIEDFDNIGKRILSEGDGIQEADHPSFRDPVYKKRRDYIAQVAFDYRVNDAAIPSIEYTPEEKGVWKHCYSKLKPMLQTNACYETNFTIREMEENIKGFSENDIP
jgi:tryptophan 5-monooxygenase